MLDLNTVTIETFTPCLHQMFHIEYGGSAPFPLELADVRPVSQQRSRLGRLPFSLIFRGGRGDYLPQHLYRVRHDALGELSIFLVPLGPDAEGVMQYEAVFG